MKDVHYMLSADNRVKKFLSYTSKLGLSLPDRADVLDWFIRSLEYKEHADFCQSVLDNRNVNLLSSLAPENRREFTSYQFLTHVDDLSAFLIEQRKRAGLFNSVNELGYSFNRIVLREHILIKGFISGEPNDRVQAGQPVQFKNLRHCYLGRTVPATGSSQCGQLARTITWL